MNINGYIPLFKMLYTLPMNINGYVPLFKMLYTLPMNINRYVPIPHKYVGQYCEGVKYTKLVHH